MGILEYFWNSTHVASESLILDIFLYHIHIKMRRIKAGDKLNPRGRLPFMGTNLTRGVIIPGLFLASGKLE